MHVKVDSWTGRSWIMRYYKKGDATVWYWEEVEQK